MSDPDGLSGKRAPIFVTSGAAVAFALAAVEVARAVVTVPAGGIIAGRVRVPRRLSLPVLLLRVSSLFVSSLSLSSWLVLSWLVLP